MLGVPHSDRRYRPCRDGHASPPARTRATSAPGRRRRHVHHNVLWTDPRCGNRWRRHEAQQTHDDAVSRYPRTALDRRSGSRLDTEPESYFKAVEPAETPPCRSGTGSEARVGHLRTFGGNREIDLIVERADERVLAIVVKLGGAVDDADVKHFLWLQRELGENVVGMVVLSTGPRAYRRPDGVAVIPLALLGP